MSRRTPKLLILDMLEAIEKIELYVQNMSYNDLLGDMKTQDAVVRNIEILGEAANRIPKEIQEAFKDINWKAIAGSRHKIVHDYFGVDMEIIWAIISKDLPELKQNLQNVENTI